LGGILPQKQQLPASWFISLLTLEAFPDKLLACRWIDAVQGWTDLEPLVRGAVRGAEHRSQRRKRPEVARRWIAALAQQYRDVLSAQPGAGEKHRAVGFARCEPDHRVTALAFLVTFWATAKK